MSVVVATQFLHNLNKDETEVRFLTNARVPLPAIRHSQIEKQLLNQLNPPEEHIPVVKNQLYKEVFEIANKMQASAMKELNSRHRISMIEEDFQKRLDRKVKELARRQSDVQHRKEASMNIQKKKFKERQVKRKQVVQHFKQLKLTSLKQSDKARTQLLSTLETRMNIKQNRYLHRRQTSILTNVARDTMTYTIPTNEVRHKRFGSQTVQPLPQTQMKPKSRQKPQRLVSTQSTKSIKQRFLSTNSREETEKLFKAVKKNEKIVKARQSKDSLINKILGDTRLKKEQLRKVHIENLKKASLVLRQKQQKVIDKESRCLSTNSARSTRTLSSVSRLTRIPSEPKILGRPSYSKPIRDKLYPIALEFYRVLKNREQELIMKK